MIKGLVLAAVAATSIGSAAGAATFLNYNLWLRYDGTSFREASYAKAGPTGDLIAEGDFPAESMLPGMRSYLHGDMEMGELISLSINVVHPDVPVEDDLYYGNGGRTPICSIGSWDCTQTNFTSLDGGTRPPAEQFAIAYDDIWSIRGSSAIGSILSTQFWTGLTELPVTSSDGLYQWWYSFETSYFTVVDAPNLAPVPLPASAALLPLGLGALAMMRKRRRHSHP